MKFSVKAAVSVAALSVVAAPAMAQTTGPKATYWVDAATTSGMGAGGMGYGASAAAMARQSAYEQAGAEQPEYEQPSVGMSIGGALGGDAGAALGGLFGGKKKKGAPAPAPRQAQAAPQPRAMPANYVHTLNLHLGSTQKAAGEPSAEHLPPAGLQAGPSLPLVSPRQAPPVQTQPYQGYGTGPAKGRMIIYWGCGEHAAAPPITIDLAKIGPGMKTSPFPVINANPGSPPAAGKQPSYGEWPNDRSRTDVPAGGSLAGAHTVRGNYSPEIHFSVDGGHDFMAPLNITNQSPSPGGGRLVTWNAVPAATGYYAYFMGSSGQGETMVMWSSSSVAGAFGPLMDYLPPSEVRRLITQKAVLPPTTTQCIVPSEVVQAAPMGMLSMIAYGDELNVSNPPKPAKGPWNIDYTVKLRLKSTTMTMLGLPSY